jgi:hypothetical protein
MQSLIGKKNLVKNLNLIFEVSLPNNVNSTQQKKLKRILNPLFSSWNKNQHFGHIPICSQASRGVIFGTFFSASSVSISTATPLIGRHSGIRSGRPAAIDIQAAWKLHMIIFGLKLRGCV